MSTRAVAESHSFDDGLTAVRGTLAELRDLRLAWDHDVTSLFDDFDALAVRFTLETASEKSPRQELSTIRGMITQQMELLTAFIEAATPFEPARALASSPA
jgi:hypothetical protein